MDFVFLSAVFRRCKRIYGKMLVFSISLGLILVLSSVLIILLSGSILLSVLALLIFAFAFLPLFLSYELVSMRLLTGHEANYDEIYKNYKAYFSPVFRGCYSLIFAGLLTFIIADILLSSYVSIIAANNVSLFEEFMNTQDISMFFNLPYFSVGLIIILGICMLFFFYRFLSRVNLPYFNFYFGLPSSVTKRMLRLLKKRARATYQKQIRTVALPFLFIFCLLYFPLAIGLYFPFGESVALLSATIVSILGCSLYLPFYLSGCFLTFYTHRGQVMRFIQEEVQQDLMRLENMPDVPEEEKAKLRALFENFKKNSEEAEKNLDDEFSNLEENNEVDDENGNEDKE